MKKNIYNYFAEKWYKPGGTIYFYSDPHFGDEEMSYIRKDYIGDLEQVKSINKRVGKNDTIIILGDIGDPKWLSMIRGEIVLILGNHDKGASYYYPYVKPENIFEGILTIADNIILSHEPLETYQYALNIHGHDHSGFHETFNSFNVCAEVINYCPIPIKDIVKSGKLKKAINIHRSTIDIAIEKKKN